MPQRYNPLCPRRYDLAKLKHYKEQRRLRGVCAACAESCEPGSRYCRGHLAKRARAASMRRRQVIAERSPELVQMIAFDRLWKRVGWRLRRLAKAIRVRCAQRAHLSQVPPSI